MLHFTWTAKGPMMTLQFVPQKSVHYWITHQSRHVRFRFDDFSDTTFDVMANFLSNGYAGCVHTSEIKNGQVEVLALFWLKRMHKVYIGIMPDEHTKLLLNPNEFVDQIGKELQNAKESTKSSVSQQIILEANELVEVQLQHNQSSSTGCSPAKKACIKQEKHTHDDLSKGKEILQQTLDATQPPHVPDLHKAINASRKEKNTYDAALTIQRLLSDNSSDLDDVLEEVMEMEDDNDNGNLNLPEVQEMPNDNDRKTRKNGGKGAKRSYPSRDKKEGPKAPASDSDEVVEIEINR